MTTLGNAWDGLQRARPLTRVAVFALLAVVAGGVIALAVQRGQAMVAGTDFHGRWIAGRWFMTGQPLYVYQPGLADPTYPPFAAMVFQVFALLPLPVAAGLFFVVNLALVPVAVQLVRRILTATWPAWSDGWALVLAGVFSIEYFLTNLNSIQVNVALFVLVLWGIAAWLDGHERRATVAFVVATGIKLIPVFFVCWAMLRGRRPVVVTALVAGAAVAALPVLQRGPTQGLRDVREYHATLLAGALRGEVNARATNHSFGGAVHRLTRPPQPPEPDYRVAPLSAGGTRSLIRTGAIAMALAFLGTVLGLRLRREPLSAFEWSAAFLVGHLVSALTWRAHLVTLLFVLTAFFSIPVRTLPKPARWTWWTMAGLVAVIGLSGRDLVGRPAFNWINGHGIISLTLLLLLGVALICSHRRWRIWERPQVPTR